MVVPAYYRILLSSLQKERLKASGHLCEAVAPNFRRICRHFATGVSNVTARGIKGLLATTSNQNKK